MTRVDVRSAPGGAGAVPGGDLPGHVFTESSSKDRYHFAPDGDRNQQEDRGQHDRVCRAESAKGGRCLSVSVVRLIRGAAGPGPDAAYAFPGSGLAS